MAKVKAGKETISQETIDHQTNELELKTQELKLHETKKPEKLRADLMPLEGFVLSVDGKLKMRYETSKDAMAAASKLKQKYPVLQIAIYDAAERNYTRVESGEHEN
jgi:hypothetical protein